MNGLALFPARSLVANTGFDGSGTHCPPRQMAAPAAMRPCKLRYPEQVALSPDRDKVFAAVTKTIGVSGFGMKDKIKSFLTAEWSFPFCKSV
jgi:hypothetical protein